MRRGDHVRQGGADGVRAWDEKVGMTGSLGDIVRHPRLKHQAEVLAGVLAEECGAPVREFFASGRWREQGGHLATAPCDKSRRRPGSRRGNWRDCFADLPTILLAQLEGALYAVIVGKNDTGVGKSQMPLRPGSKCLLTPLKPNVR
jgi:hypothetical protein